MAEMSSKVIMSLIKAAATKLSKQGKVTNKMINVLKTQIKELTGRSASIAPSLKGFEIRVNPAAEGSKALQFLVPYASKSTTKAAAGYAVTKMKATPKAIDYIASDVSNIANMPKEFGVPSGSIKNFLAELLFGRNTGRGLN
jgi:hypothetical protein